jgi:hypothetical protein
MQAAKTAFVAVLIFTSASAVAAEESPIIAENSAMPPTAATVNASDTAKTNTAAAAIGYATAPTLTNDASLNIDVRVKLESGPGQIPASRAYITVGTNRFAFLVPGGFKIDTSDGQRVLMVRADCGCVLSIRILETLSSPGLTADVCRQKILQEHPSCTIDAEFSLAAGNSAGPAFEIRWKGDGGVRRSARIAYVPMYGGVVEFALDSSPEKFGAMLTHLNDVMLTFRASDATGKIEPTPLYDNI